MCVCVLYIYCSWIPTIRLKNISHLQITKSTHLRFQGMSCPRIASSAQNPLWSVRSHLLTWDPAKQGFMSSKMLPSSHHEMVSDGQLMKVGPPKSSMKFEFPGSKLPTSHLDFPQICRVTGIRAWGTPCSCIWGRIGTKQQLQTWQKLAETKNHLEMSWDQLIIFCWRMSNFIPRWISGPGPPRWLIHQWQKR